MYGNTTFIEDFEADGLRHAQARDEQRQKLLVAAPPLEWETAPKRFKREDAAASQPRSHRAHKELRAEM